jgi:CheY-like chemotaxis protein
MQSYNLTKLNVLILENNKLIRQLMSNVFHEFGVRKGLKTGNPDHAFEMFSSNNADIIISDWSPELDGIEFLKRIRSAPESPDPFVPIIICTGNTEKQHVLTARDAGMTEFLVKPVSAKTIYSRIVSVIEKHRQFIRNDSYFGPDCRRHVTAEIAVERRKIFAAS